MFEITRRRPRLSAVDRAARILLRGAAALLSAALVVGSSEAAVTTVFDFEDGNLGGFLPNGGGVAVEQDTIGATAGPATMKIDIVAGATFVGALSTFLPEQIGDPPGVSAIVFDLTLVEPFAGPGFVNAGITIFGASQFDYPGGQQFGLQVQFLGNEFAVGALPAGTHEVRMELTKATHPLTFEVGSFNDIIGSDGSGPNDVIPTGFQIYINKSNTAPWTGYVDNIRVVQFDADFDGNGTVEGADLPTWEGAIVGGTAAGDADCNGVTDGNDVLVWQRQLGGGPVVAGVPEPSAAMLAGLGATMFGRRRQQ